MDFVFATTGGLVALVLLFLLIARLSSRTGAEILDWKPARSFETEMALEAEEVDQMVEARNERLRRKGRAEISEAEFRADVDAAERAQRERAARYRTERAGRVAGAEAAVREQREAADRYRAERAAPPGREAAARRPTRADRAARRKGRSLAPGSSASPPPRRSARPPSSER